MLGGLAIGAGVGPFVVVEEVGRGAHAVVYGARHSSTGEDVALKWLPAHGNVGQLKREFRIARSLSHRHLVRLHEMHQVGEGLFFTMERVAGPDLIERCRREPPSTRVALVRALFRQLAEAIQFLHSAALLHRDLKPGNVLVDAGDRVVVVDFGLAQPLDAPLTPGFSGTLAYAAPERLTGHAATRASDWFSFGVLLFEALSGELPHGDDPLATFGAWIEGRTSDVRHRIGEAADDLGPLVESLLEPLPERRADERAVFEVLGAPARWALKRTRVGDEAPRATLAEHLGRPSARLLAVVGAAGTGKTTLVREGLEALRTTHFVVTSRCHPRENVPFNALDGAATALVDQVRRSGAPLEPTTREQLSLLEAVFGSSTQAAEHATPAHVAKSVLGLLELAARGRTGVLWIDDLQWADRDSLPLVRRVLAEAKPGVKVIVTARGGSEDLPIELDPATDVVISLGPLDEAQSVALVQGIAPAIGLPLARSLSALSGGNPLVLEQAARFAAERPEEGLPPDFLQLMLRVSRGRSRAHQDLLDALAVHQGALDTEVLLACEGLTLSAAYDLLEAGLVEFERTPVHYRVRLGHQEITEALLATLAGERRVHYHRRIAEALERAKPEDVDAAFEHWRAAGEDERARRAALASARGYRDSLAFHRAADRYRWLVDHEREPTAQQQLRHELAASLSRGGAGMEAGDIYLDLAREARGLERDRLYRSAAEQLLRSGDTERGRRVLDGCLARAGLSFPKNKPALFAQLLWRRFRIRRVSIAGERSFDPPAEQHERIELAWSAGLGLSLVDVVSSTFAQAHFTDMALHSGTREQIARALSVEYSYTMFAGGAFAEARGRALRATLGRLRDQLDLPYTRAMMDLSWAAGDLFRGHLFGVRSRIEHAQHDFESTFGAKSWELTNCGMYSSWAALEAGDLAGVAASVPELLRLGTERGDILYRQCFAGGYCATAWLISDRADELRARLDELPAPSGPFQMRHFFDLVARTRLDLYERRGAKALTRLEGVWPAIEASGFLQLRWSRLALGLLLVQAALAAGGRERRMLAARWIARIRSIDHPSARPWADALDAALGRRSRPRRETIARLESAERGFRAIGFDLAAQCVRHALSSLSTSAAPDWSAIVKRPDALARAVGLPDLG